MIEIGRAIVCLDLFIEHFACNLSVCRGACCIEGDSGAPLTDKEAVLIGTEYINFVDFLPDSHRSEIEKQGFSLIDSDGDLVTPLVNNQQCAYSFYDDQGILKCAIEKAFFDGKTNFRKPVSCHLFPVRISEYRHFDAVNYQKIEICQSGRECGQHNRIPLYQFLKEPFIRKYGEEWYIELENLARDKNFIRKIKSL
jgi:hypothetical protein